MTEEQLERRAEQRMDSLDRQLIGNTLTQAEYDMEVKRIDTWVARELTRVDRSRE